MAKSRKDSKGRVLEKGYSQRADGRYCYRYQEDKKTKTIYDTSLPELKKKVKQLQRDIDDNIKSKEADTATLNLCFDKYMDLKKGIRETTKNNNKYLYDKFVRETIGKKIIKNIRYSEILSFYNSLLEDGVKFGTVRLIHNLISPSFELAINDNLARSNPAKKALKDIRNNTDTKQEKRLAMSREEQTAFMKYARESNIYKVYVPMFTVFLGTGLRVGECLALTWKDIDFNNGFINVNKTLTYKVDADGEARFHISEPKTESGKRSIPILAAVRKALIEEREKRLSRGICETVVDGVSDFVFVNSRNHVHKPNTINRVMDSIIKGHNQTEEVLAKDEKRKPLIIRHFSVHNLRHTFLTNYCQIETNLKTIKEIAGHSDISITMNVYAEATAESKKESFEKLEGKFLIG